CMDKEWSAGEIAEHLGTSASLTSHQPAFLRSAWILNSVRRGKQVFYAMSDECIHSALTIVIDHMFTHRHGAKEKT
ncbi:MAG: hypothetical protein AAGJ89_11270, partial [Pseudomonadota bacterium]